MDTYRPTPRVFIEGVVTMGDKALVELRALNEADRSEPAAAMRQALRDLLEQLNRLDEIPRVLAVVPKRVENKSD